MNPIIVRTHTHTKKTSVIYDKPVSCALRFLKNTQTKKSIKIKLPKNRENNKTKQKHRQLLEWLLNYCTDTRQELENENVKEKEIFVLFFTK